jgi:ABC-type amino acid transport substrate-binding protein
MTTVFISILVALFLAGPAQGAELEGTLKKIKGAGMISMGYRSPAPPFSFLREDAVPAGYSVDLCQHIVAAIRRDLGTPNLPTRWIRVTPADRVEMLKNGTIDIECGSTTNTRARRERVAFTHTIYVGGAGLLVTAASGITGVAGLGGKRVGVIPGTTTEKALTDALKKHNVSARVVQMTRHAEALAALEGGILEAYASDRIVLVDLAAKAKDPSKFRVTDEYLSREHYALMVRRGDAPFLLVANQVLSGLYRSGEIVPIYEKWFGTKEGVSRLIEALNQPNALPD